MLPGLAITAASLGVLKVRSIAEKSAFWEVMTEVVCTDIPGPPQRVFTTVPNSTYGDGLVYREGCRTVTRQTVFFFLANGLYHLLLNRWRYSQVYVEIEEFRCQSRSTFGAA